MKKPSGRQAGAALPKGIGAPATRALAGAGIESMTDLKRFTEQQLAELHGVGPKALRVLREAMPAAKVRFASGGKPRPAGKKAPATKAASRAEKDAAEVASYLKTMKHPFRRELLLLREIFLGASPKLAERIKWSSPSFHYRRDFAVFHPREERLAMIVVVFPPGTMVDDPDGILQGDFQDRRLLKFSSLEEVKAKRAALERLVSDWVALVEGEGT